jgi:hypothetical protein
LLADRLMAPCARLVRFPLQTVAIINWPFVFTRVDDMSFRKTPSRGLSAMSCGM